MKNKRVKQKWFFIAIFVLSAVFIALTAFYSKVLAISGGLVLVAFVTIYFIFRQRWKNEHFYILSEFAKGLDKKEKNSLMSLPSPVVLVYGNGEIIWHNEHFINDISTMFSKKSQYIGDYLNGFSFEELIKHGSAVVEYENGCFSLFLSKVSLDDEKFLIYFFDISELKAKADKLDKIQPAVLIGMYDNFDEMFQNLTDSELSELTSILDKEVSKWFSKFNCVLRKIGSERFIVICHEKDLKNMINDKFSVLSVVRDCIFYDKPCCASLSIGVGRGEEIALCDADAKQALDMALSRGGDQVAINGADGFTFYGGLSSGNDRVNRVRSRVVANAIKQLIMSSDNALIMGHKFPDYDSMGSAIAISSVMKHFGKSANIVYDYENSLAGKLVDKYVSETGYNLFIDKRMAAQFLTENTLVFILDTHRASYCEAPEVVNSAKNVVVIDHHRKAVDFFDKAVVFHHNPSASSASEMVAELLPYISNVPVIGPTEADALLSGIMLDTRNFVLRSGVRTFEAASYLKSRGADPVKVKKLFSVTSEEHKLRSEIIKNNFVYRDCAIVTTELKHKDIRIITSQVADEMLGICGVKGSFVIFRTEDMINISARSLGEINVQLIMEALGGGGHLTMAACQLKNVNFSEAPELLKKSIDDYYDNI